MLMNCICYILVNFYFICYIILCSKRCLQYFHLHHCQKTLKLKLQVKVLNLKYQSVVFRWLLHLVLLASKYFHHFWCLLDIVGVQRAEEHTLYYFPCLICIRAIPESQSVENIVVVTLFFSPLTWHSKLSTIPLICFLLKGKINRLDLIQLDQTTCPQLLFMIWQKEAWIIG